MVAAGEVFFLLFTLAVAVILALSDCLTNTEAKKSMVSPGGMVPSDSGLTQLLADPFLNEAEKTTTT